MDDLTVVPARHGPFPGRLAPGAIAAYAAATGDQTPAVLNGVAVPAVFPVILVFEGQETARADLPAAAWQRIRGGVHGEHDIVLHRPLVPDEPLDTWSQISAVRTSRAGTQVVVHLEQVDAEGRVAVEQWWTTHGLCTMAICTHRLLGLLGVDDPGRVARVAVRFASPTPLGEELTVNAYGIDQNSFGFEATSRDVPTITHGRLELRP